MNTIVSTVGGLLLKPLVSGIAGRVTRHSITPAAILMAGGDGFTQGIMETLQAEAHVYGAMAGAFVASLILSKVSDALQEIRERR